MDEDWLRPCKQACCSGNHYWRTAQEAARCCNGWWPVPVPFPYCQNLDFWANTTALPQLEDDVPWVTVLIPTTERELYTRLVALCDPAFLRRLHLNPHTLLSH